MLKTKIVSSQEKIFFDSSIDSFDTLEKISALRGEKLSLQLLHVDSGEGEYLPIRPFCELTLGGELAPYATMREVRYVPVDRPTRPGVDDGKYLRLTPGVYPDILTPLRYGGKLCPSRDKLRSVWIEVKIPEDLSGEKILTVTLTEPETGVSHSHSVTVDVIPVSLPEGEMHFTQWFYPDCLATYYNVPMWSDRHFEIVENFAKCAVERGRDTLLVPLFTPALNVLPGFERAPSQLVEVRVDNGEYSFDFERLGRYLDMCDRVGVKLFEISHFYQQYQGKYAAHIYATVDGEYKRLFGWETLALDEEYKRFLRELVHAFVGYMKQRGDDTRCLYHITDEPYLSYIDQYKALTEVVAEALSGYKIIDALSDFEFYKEGVLDHPVPTTSSAPKFIEAGVKDLWVYYACGEVENYSNCYLAMPTWRTRSIGMQLYKYNIDGFLHWGFNYYNNRASGDAINPYMELSGEDWVPAGDCFVVYPDSDGTPLESIRLMTLEEAMQDIRAMRLAEELYSHEEVVREIEKVLSDELSFTRCAHSSREMLRVREGINEMIKKKI